MSTNIIRHSVDVGKRINALDSNAKVCFALTCASRAVKPFMQLGPPDFDFANGILKSVRGWILGQMPQPHFDEMEVGQIMDRTEATDLGELWFQALGNILNLVDYMNLDAYSNFSRFGNINLDNLCDYIDRILQIPAGPHDSSIPNSHPLVLQEIRRQNGVVSQLLQAKAQCKQGDFFEKVLAECDSESIFEIGHVESCSEFGKCFRDGWLILK